MVKEKKTYNGLAVDVISFGTDAIETGVEPFMSGCYLGSVTYYTEDEQGHPLPMGVCWDKTQQQYSLHWEDQFGDYTYP